MKKITCFKYLALLFHNFFCFSGFVFLGDRFLCADPFDL